MRTQAQKLLEELSVKIKIFLYIPINGIRRTTRLLCCRQSSDIGKIKHDYARKIQKMKKRNLLYKDSCYKNLNK